MKNDHVQNSQTAHRFLFMVCLVALAVTFTVARPQPAYADDEIVVPDVPVKLEVPAGHKVFLEGHAIGTQNYVCVRLDPSAALSWIFFGPQATLFNDHERQIITHFLSSNPDPEDKGNSVRLGRTHVTRVPYGPCRCRRPLSPSLQGPFPGSSSRSLVLNPAPLVDRDSQEPSASSD